MSIYAESARGLLETITDEAVRISDLDDDLSGIYQFSGLCRLITPLTSHLRQRLRGILDLANIITR